MGRGSSQGLGGSPVQTVPVPLTFDAARGGRLVAEASLRNPVAAALADPVRAFAEPLERALDLLPVLVEQVDQDVARLAVGQRLREVGLFGNPRDHAADDVVERPVETGLLAALRSQHLQTSPVCLQELLGSLSCLLPLRHVQNPPPNSIPATAAFGFRDWERLHQRAYPLTHN